MRPLRDVDNIWFQLQEILVTVKEYKDEGELVYTSFYLWKFTFSTFLKARSRVRILNRYVLQILTKLEKVL